MSVRYDKQTDSLHILLTQDIGESYEPKSGKFVVYIDRVEDQIEIVIEKASQFLSEVAKKGANIEGSPDTPSKPSKPVWEDVDSSMISAFKYDESSQILEVIFHRTGLYRYFDVPVDAVEGLRESSSKGSYMRSMIIDYYAFEKGKSRR